MDVDEVPTWVGWHRRITLARFAFTSLTVARQHARQHARRLLTNTALIDRHFADLDELEEAQARRCVALKHRRNLIRSAIRFHCWPLRIKKRQGPRTT